MSGESPAQRPAAKDPLLDVAEAAARFGMQPGSWRAAVSRGYLPPPDEPDDDAPRQRRRPRWRRSTLDAIRRPGPGTRTDLVRERKEQTRARQAELAEPAPAGAGDLRQWLRDHHGELLAVAEALVDHRDALLAATAGAAVREQLAETIDAAGEAMSRQPTRTLAGAVTYAQFLLRDVVVPVQAREVLARHARLSAQYDALRRT